MALCFRCASDGGRAHPACFAASSTSPTSRPGGPSSWRAEPFLSGASPTRTYVRSSQPDGSSVGSGGLLVPPEVIVSSICLSPSCGSATEVGDRRHLGTRRERPAERERAARALRLDNDAARRSRKVDARRRSCCRRGVVRRTATTSWVVRPCAQSDDGWLTATGSPWTFRSSRCHGRCGRRSSQPSFRTSASSGATSR
jgi:hypothetical protein